MKLVEPASRANRVYGLDILRAFAILFVVYGHGCFILGKLIPLKWVSFLIFDGVSIFFVLSGFLIGGILIKTLERHDAVTLPVLFHFWKRRWFRTLPNYFLVLIVLLLLRLPLEQGDLPTLAKYFFFVQNVATPHPGFFPEAWSLSIEEWFYLTAPLSLLILIKVGVEKQKAILLVIALFIMFSISVRFHRHLTLDLAGLRGWDALLRKQIITRLDSVMVGVMGAYVHHFHPRVWLRRPRTLFAAGVILLILHRLSFVYKYELIAHMPVYFTVFSFLVIAVGTLFMLPLLTQVKQGSGKLYEWFTMISLISYSMYLVNLSLVRLKLVPMTLQVLPVALSGVSSILVEYSLFWIYTLTLSILIYRFFEVPTTRLRDRF